MMQEMMDAWNTPAMRHAMVVHLPLALSMLGLPLAAISAAKPKSGAWRWGVIVAYALLLGGAWMARSSGLAAEGRAGADLSRGALAHLDTHAKLGNVLFLLALGVVALFSVAAIPHRLTRLGGSIVGLLLAVLTAGWASVTAHHGGMLVYAHGVGARAFDDPATPENERASTLSRSGNAEGGDTTAANFGDVVAEADPRIAHLQSRVLPILRDRCMGCHNPSRASHNGDFDLTTMAAILRGGSLGAAIVPGNVDESPLIQAVRYDDPFLQMPPSKAGGRLADEDIAALEQWVREGAAWSDPVPVPAQPDES